VTTYNTLTKVNILLTDVATQAEKWPWQTLHYALPRDMAIATSHCKPHIVRSGVLEVWIENWPENRSTECACSERSALPWGAAYPYALAGQACSRA